MTHRDPSLLASTWAGSLFSFYSNTGGDCDSREPDHTVFWGWLLLKEFMQRKWKEGGLGSCRLSSSKNERQSAFNKKKKNVINQVREAKRFAWIFFLSRGNEKTWIPFISCRKIHGILVLGELATLDRKKKTNKQTISGACDPSLASIYLSRMAWNLRASIKMCGSTGRWSLPTTWRSTTSQSSRTLVPLVWSCGRWLGFKFALL